MGPPRTCEDRGARCRRDERREQRGDGRWRRIQQVVELVTRRSDGSTFEDEQREHQEADECEDHVALARDVHVRRMDDQAPREGDGDRREYQEREEVERPRIQAAVRSRELPSEDTAQQQIGAAVRDDQEAPEDERVRDAAQVVGTLDELALAEVDHELVAQAAPGMVDPVLRAAEPQQADEQHGAPRERAEAENDQREQHEDAHARGRSYH